MATSVGPNPALNRTRRYAASPSVGFGAAGRLADTLGVILRGASARKETLVSILRRLVVIAAFVSTSLAIAADGLVAVKSPYSAKDTMNRLEEIVKQRGLIVFARVDHAAGAGKVGKTLRPTEVLIFGNPQGGTPFMECAQSVGIDLPLKALVWEDSSSQVWLGYNDPAFLAQRHGVAQCPVIETLRKALAGIAEATVAR
jgi:uncharacterized protein (DUF302 family)